MIFQPVSFESRTSAILVQLRFSINKAHRPKAKFRILSEKAIGVLSHESSIMSQNKQMHAMLCLMSRIPLCPLACLPKSSYGSYCFSSNRRENQQHALWYHVAPQSHVRRVRALWLRGILRSVFFVLLKDAHQGETSL